ncbi:MAG: aldehyde dehydrogenase family protein [Pseudomonadales bacterium]|nr:aldehyde dehydrogenase family protein [Pseudomonadales bacterium]
MATNKSEVMSGAFTGERFDVVNPRTGRADYVFTAPADRELTARLAALRAAQPAWRDAGLEARIAVMARWRAALVEHRDAIVRALATDTGRYWIPVSEFNAVLGYIDRWSHDAVLLTRESQGESRSMPALRWRSQHIPYSLVGVISPWNFPFTLAVIDAIPALLAGCAVCVKPSEITPRFAAPLAASIAAVPELARVLAVIPGGRGMGEALVAQSDVVCFTGSVKTGRLVGENAARHFVPAFLELGGKDPLIVTASADLGRATDVALRASVLATGQACQSLERVHVDRRIYQPFVDQLVAKARKVELNWPDLHAGHIGPFIWGRQGDIVAAQLADAEKKGARVLCGGKIEDHGGKWLAPTVLVDVKHDMAIMQEETFGPVIPVIPYDSVDEAVALANDGDYGLSAGVMAGTLEEAEQIGRRIDAGGVSLNDGSLTALMHEAEKNSFKLSGLGGSRMGPAGYLRFFRTKVLIHQTGTPMTIDMIDERHARPAN